MKTARSCDQYGRSITSMSSSTYPNAMKKNHFKFLLTLCVVALAAQVIGPSSSLHAQGMDHSIPTNPPPPTVIINGAKQYQIIVVFAFSQLFGPPFHLLQSHPTLIIPNYYLFSS